MTVEIMNEMAKQASLGHKQFCVGVHEDGTAEWVSWEEAFAPLRELHTKYYDLIYQVSKVRPNETRHDSARRIIQVHEDECGRNWPAGVVR